MRNDYQPRSGGLSQLNEPPFSPRKLKMMRTYPDMFMAYQMFAEFFGISTDNLILGNGFENVMKSTLLAVRPSTLSYSVPCWGFIDVYAEQMGIHKDVHNYMMDSDAMIDEDFDDVDIYYASSPSNNLFKTYTNGKNMFNARYVLLDVSYANVEQLKWFIDNVFDVNRNIILLGSFDKLLGCGLRLGFAIYPSRHNLHYSMNIQREQFLNTSAADVCIRIGEYLDGCDESMERYMSKFTWCDDCGCVYRNFNFMVFDGWKESNLGRRFQVRNRKFTRFGMPSNEAETKELELAIKGER